MSIHSAMIVDRPLTSLRENLLEAISSIEQSRDRLERIIGGQASIITGQNCREIFVDECHKPVPPSGRVDNYGWSSVRNVEQRTQREKFRKCMSERQKKPFATVRERFEQPTISLSRESTACESRIDQDSECSSDSESDSELPVQLCARVNPNVPALNLSILRSCEVYEEGSPSSQFESGRSEETVYDAVESSWIWRAGESMRELAGRLIQLANVIINQNADLREQVSGLKKRASVAERRRDSAVAENAMLEEAVQTLTGLVRSREVWKPVWHADSTPASTRLLTPRPSFLIEPPIPLKECLPEFSPESPPSIPPFTATFPEEGPLTRSPEIGHTISDEIECEYIQSPAMETIASLPSIVDNEAECLADVLDSSRNAKNTKLLGPVLTEGGPSRPVQITLSKSQGRIALQVFPRSARAASLKAVQSAERLAPRKQRRRPSVQVPGPELTVAGKSFAASTESMRQRLEAQKKAPVISKQYEMFKIRNSKASNRLPLEEFSAKRSSYQTKSFCCFPTKHSDKARERDSGSKWFCGLFRSSE